MDIENKKRSKKILIIDDERDYTMLLRRKLEPLGCEVVEASNASEIFRAIMNESFDLVLLDFAMREIRGDKICRLIREDEKSKNTPILFVTAYYNVGEEMFKTYGATDVIYKPVDHGELMEKIQKYLGLTSEQGGAL